MNYLRFVLCLIVALNYTRPCHHCGVGSLLLCRAKFSQGAALGGSRVVAVGRCWSRSHIPRFLRGRAKLEKTRISFLVAGLQLLHSHSNRLMAGIDPARCRRVVGGSGSPSPEGWPGKVPGAAAGRRHGLKGQL